MDNQKIDDGHEWLTFRYMQEKGVKGIRITIEDAK